MQEKINQTKVIVSICLRHHDLKLFGHISIYQTMSENHKYQSAFPTGQRQALQHPLCYGSSGKQETAFPILASVYTACPLDEEAARKLYADYYAAAAFTHATTRSIDLKQVVNTNISYL